VTASLARIVNKIFAAIVMGLVGVFVIGFPVILAVVPSLNGDPNPSVVVGWTFLGPGIAVVATIAVTVFAPTGRIAWARLCLLNGLASLGLPLAGIVFAVFGHHASQLAVSYTAETGVKIGTGLGGTTVPGMLGFAGFFLGAIFLVLAFIILWNAPRPSLPTPGALQGLRQKILGAAPLKSVPSRPRRSGWPR
jgi:hypothetical protein